MTSPAPEFNVGDWDIDSLRVSIFHAAPSSLIKPSLWKEVTGTSPESVNDRPKEGRIIAKGDEDGNQFILIIQDQRLDWQIRPVLPTRSLPGTLLSLASVEKTLPLLRKAVRRSTGKIPQVHRLAFAPIFIKNAPNQSEGLQALSTYLPAFSPGSLKGSDFIYQINRPRSSSVVPYLQINRLAKWEMQEFLQGTVSINSAKAPQVTTTPTPARLLHLDINNVPWDKGLPGKRTLELFDELVMLACELATKGDVF